MPLQKNPKKKRTKKVRNKALEATQDEAQEKPKHNPSDSPETPLEPPLEPQEPELIHKDAWDFPTAEPTLTDKFVGATEHYPTHVTEYVLKQRNPILRARPDKIESFVNKTVLKGIDIEKHKVPDYLPKETQEELKAKKEELQEKQYNERKLNYMLMQERRKGKRVIR